MTEIYISSLVLYNHSPGEDTICHTGSHTGGIQEQNEKAEATGGRFYSNKMGRCALVATEGCDWLVWIIPQPSRELKPTTQGEVNLGLGPCDEEHHLAGMNYPQKYSWWDGEGPADGPGEAFAVLPDVKIMHDLEPYDTVYVC